MGDAVMLRSKPAMAKKTAKEPVRVPAKTQKRQPMSDQAKARLRKVVGHTLAAILFVGVCGGAFHVSQRYVARITQTEQPPGVVLADQPAWMSPVLAEQIIGNVRPRT